MSSQILLAKLADAKGIDQLAFDKDGICQLEIESETLTVALETNPEGTLLHAAVELRRFVDEAEAAQVIGALMVVNAAYNPDGRGIFALEGDNADHVIFMRLFDAERIPVEHFLAALETFLSDAIEWRRRLMKPDLGMEEDNEDDAKPESAPVIGGMRV